MTREYMCLGCGRGIKTCICPAPDDAGTRHLLAYYREVRLVISEMEGYLGRVELEEQKDLDKAVTVMKVGAKIVKRVLRRRGVKGHIKTEVPE